MSDEKNKVEVFEDEKKILLDHEYDGIKELDNPLPNWWLTTFFLTIAFAIPYYIAHTFLGAESIKEELASDMETLEQKQAEFEAKQGAFNVSEYEAYIAQADVLKVGKKVYKRKCRACHGKHGEGGVGPNLTDAYWINGNGSLKDVYKVIDKGVVEKGMAAWGDDLGKERTFAVLKYVMDLKGTNPENAKEPQGQLYE